MDILRHIFFATFPREKKSEYKTITAAEREIAATTFFVSITFYYYLVITIFLGINYDLYFFNKLFKYKILINKLINSKI